MPTYATGGSTATFQTVLDSFAWAPGLPFQDVLTAERIEAVAAAEHVDFGSAPGDVYSVPVTLWAFLAQVLSKEKACVAAVARVLVLRLALGLPPCASETGAYCKARAKLPETFLQRLCEDAAEQVESRAPADWLWKGRHVFLGDGSTLSMPDTPDNQQAYPQPRTQKRGLGFPILRVVVLLALATAVLTGAALGPYVGKNQGEPALLRTLLGRLRPGDILLGDRYYGSYWLIALAQQRGIDVVFRQHQRRACDFRRGVHLGPQDHVVVWTKPQRPDWLDEPTYQALPETLTVRELRARVAVPGYRTQEVTVVTTLLDAATYTKEEITGLYRLRWHVEINQADYTSSDELYGGAAAGYSRGRGAAGISPVVPALPRTAAGRSFMSQHQDGRFPPRAPRSRARAGRPRSGRSCRRTAAGSCAWPSRR